MGDYVTWPAGTRPGGDLGVFLAGAVVGGLLVHLWRTRSAARRDEAVRATDLSSDLRWAAPIVSTSEARAAPISRLAVRAVVLRTAGGQPTESVGTRFKNLEDLVALLGEIEAALSRELQLHGNLRAVDAAAADKLINGSFDELAGWVADRLGVFA